MTSDLEVLTLNGSASTGPWITLSLAQQTDGEGNLLPKTFTEVLEASDAGSEFSGRVVPIVQESWFRGVGLDYDWAPGVDTRDPDYACPAGVVTDVVIPAGGAGPIVAIEEYDGDIFFAQQGEGATFGRVLTLPGGTGSTASESLPDPGTSKYCRGLVVADDGSGNTRLYAMFSDGGIQNGEMYAYDGSSWSAVSGSFGTNGRGKAKKVTWRGRDGIKNNAIVTISGPKRVSWSRPNANPMSGSASWIEGVPIGTGYELTDLTGSRGHIFMGARDNLFDIDEVGNTPGITSFIEEQVQPGNGDAVMYLDGAVYYSMGRGLLKINVSEDGTIQEVPGQCAPGAFLPVEGCPRGYVTAMCPDQSWNVASVFDTTTRTSSIFWGKPREVLGIESPNPMIWHGPLFHFLSDYRVTRMRTSALGGDLRLWIASIGDVSGTCRLSWGSLPLAGTTLQDLMAGGSHRVTTGSAGGTAQPFSRMYGPGMKLTYDDKASRKEIHQHDVGTRGLDVATSTRLVVYTRADPTPGSTAWGTGDTVSTGPVQTITPATVTSGNTLEQRIDFFAPSGGATPPLIPFLDSLRTTAWLTAPDFGVRNMTVEYGDGVVDQQGGDGGDRGPEWTTAELNALMGRRTIVRDPATRKLRNVRIHQVFRQKVDLVPHGRWKKTITAQISFADLGAAS